MNKGAFRAAAVLSASRLKRHLSEPGRPQGTPGTPAQGPPQPQRGRVHSREGDSPKGRLVAKKQEIEMKPYTAGGTWKQRKDRGPWANVQEQRLMLMLMLRCTGPGRAREGQAPTVSDQSLSPYPREKTKSSLRGKGRKQHGENRDWLSIYSKGLIQKQLTTLNHQVCYVSLGEMGTELNKQSFYRNIVTVTADFAFCNSNFYLLPYTRGLLLFCNERNLATTGITSPLDLSFHKKDTGLLVNIVLS